MLPAVQWASGAKVTAYGIRSLERSHIDTLPQNFAIVDLQQPRNSAFQSCFYVE
jgi:hypothetical protein